MVTAKGAFGVAQHSGAVGKNNPQRSATLYFTRNLDTINRLKRVLINRPLPVVTKTKSDSQLTVTLVSGETTYREQQLVCFLSSGKPLSITGVEKLSVLICLNRVSDAVKSIASHRLKQKQASRIGTVFSG